MHCGRNRYRPPKARVLCSRHLSDSVAAPRSPVPSALLQQRTTAELRSSDPGPLIRLLVAPAARRHVPKLTRVVIRESRSDSLSSSRSSAPLITMAGWLRVGPMSPRSERPRSATSLTSGDARVAGRASGPGQLIWLLVAPAARGDTGCLGPAVTSSKRPRSATPFSSGGRQSYRPSERSRTFDLTVRRSGREARRLRS